MKGEGINNLDPDRSRMTDLSVCLAHCYQNDGSAAEAERRTALAPPEAKTFRGTRNREEWRRRMKEERESDEG